MPLFKLSDNDAFVPLPLRRFDDLERKLEDWIEQNPHILLEDEELVIFARQPRTEHGKFIDLLAVDSLGAIVVIELKRGTTPRDVIAQALEYAAWVDSLSLDELDELARRYAERKGLQAANLQHIYDRAFTVTNDDETESQMAPGAVTFNNRQRIVIVAETISHEVEQTLRYLRTRCNIDLYGVQFGVHAAGSDTVINIATVVGREISTSIPGPKSSEPSKDEDEIREWVQLPFLKQAVGNLEAWLEQQADGRFSVRRGWGRERTIRLDGRKLALYYYATKWMHVSLNNPTPTIMEELRSKLTTPASISMSGDGKVCGFNLHDEADLALFKQVVLARANVGQSAIAANLSETTPQ